MEDFATCWEGLQDPRTGNARLHDFHELLTMALSAVLCGAQGAADMALFATSKEPFLRGILRLEKGVPSHDTFSRLFRLLDPEQFSSAFERFMGLAEDDVLLGPVHGAPGADSPLQRAADAGAEFGVAADHLIEHRDRTQPGSGPQHGHDDGVEDLAERVRPPTPARRPGGGGQSRVRGDPMRGRLAHRRLGGRDGHGVGLTVLHGEPYLMIGHVAAGHEDLSS